MTPPAWFFFSHSSQNRYDTIKRLTIFYAILYLSFSFAIFFEGCEYDFNLEMITNITIKYSRGDGIVHIIHCTGESTKSATLNEQIIVEIVWLFSYQIACFLKFISVLLSYLFSLEWLDRLISHKDMCHFSNSCKPKEKNEICRSVSTRAVKCDGLFFVLQHGFQYGFQHA